MSDEEDQPTMPNDAPSGEPHAEDLAAKIRAERERSHSELDRLREDTGLQRLAQEATEGRPAGADPAYWDVDGAPEDEAPESEHREHHADVKPARMHHKTQEMDKIVLRPDPPPEEVVGEAYRPLPAGDRHARTALALGRRAPPAAVEPATAAESLPLEGYASRRVLLGVIVGGMAVAALAVIALGDWSRAAPSTSAEPVVDTSAARVPAESPSIAEVGPPVSAPVAVSAAPSAIESAPAPRLSAAPSRASTSPPVVVPRASAAPRASATAPVIATSGRIQLED